MIQESEIKKLFKLSKITISNHEIPQFAQKLTAVMNMIDSLNQVNTDNIEPMFSVCGAKQFLREDQVTDGQRESELFQNVPGKESKMSQDIKCFIVPKVLV